MHLVLALANGVFMCARSPASTILGFLHDPIHSAELSYSGIGMKADYVASRRDLLTLGGHEATGSFQRVTSIFRSLNYHYSCIKASLQPRHPLFILQPFVKTTTPVSKQPFETHFRFLEDCPNAADVMYSAETLRTGVWQ